MKIAFRTDSSSCIATGHVMRCLTLAQALRQHSCTVYFLCRDLSGHIISHIVDMGFPVIILSAPIHPIRLNSEPQLEHGHWLGVSQQEDAREVIEQVKNLAIDVLIVDHYAIDIRWHQLLRSYVKKIVVIDDLADRQHDADILLDQNFYINADHRYQSLVPKYCVKLLGPKFALLREEFRQARWGMEQRNIGKVTTILVFFGGIDGNNLTSQAVSALKALDPNHEIHVDVIVGANNPNKHIIKQLCAELKHGRYHEQVNNMAEFMLKADMAIGGGGGATLERACLGLPSLVLSLAINQQQLIHDAALKGFLYYCELNEDKVSGLKHHIYALLHNRLLRKQMCNTAMQVTDACGTQRVVQRLLCAKVKLRLAVANDEDSVYLIRNQSFVRKNSRNTAYISKNEHIQWFIASLKQPERLMLIAENHAGQITGVLRYDIITAQSVEVSIFLDQQFTGMGLAGNILQAGELWLRQHYPHIEQIQADVLPFNAASIQLFLNNHYTPSHFTYSKRLDHCE